MGALHCDQRDEREKVGTYLNFTFRVALSSEKITHELFQTHLTSARAEA